MTGLCEVAAGQIPVSWVLPSPFYRVCGLPLSQNSQTPLMQPPA